MDTGDLGRIEKGRSNTMIVVTINPQKKTTTLVSLERNTYAEIVGHNSTGKINHAYTFGGVDVENTLEFTYSGTTFNKETVQKGDYGRQERQCKVITAIVKKSMNIATITNYKKMLTAVQDNTKTDLSWDNFITIESNYREAFTTINSDHM